MSDLDPRTLVERALGNDASRDTARAGRRLVERAAAEDLLDVAYTTVPSPLGDLLVARTQQGVVRLAYLEDRTVDAVLRELAACVSPRILEAASNLDEERRQLEEYFAGRRREFDFPVDLALTGPFAARVLTRTAAIPFGRVSTYREVATDIGHARAARAVGNALGSNPIPIVVPCHRVVRTGGGMGGYTGGIHRKERLLAIERGG